MAPLNHRAGEHGDSQAQRVHASFRMRAQVIRLDGGVDHRRLRSLLRAEVAASAEQTQRRAQRWAVVGGIEEDDLAPGQHAARRLFSVRLETLGIDHWLYGRQSLLSACR